MMFHIMRRKKQALSSAESIAILQAGTSGVLALMGEDGYPYAVPLSYVYDDGKIYFHSALEGHKLAAIRYHAHDSFCVIGKDHVVAEEYTTYYQSVIAFGTMAIIEDEAENRAAITQLAKKYAPHIAAAQHNVAIEREWPAFCILRLDIDHLSGKEGIELTKARAKNEG